MPHLNSGRLGMELISLRRLDSALLVCADAVVIVVVDVLQ
jgi:hypothetical protein